MSDLGWMLAYAFSLCGMSVLWWIDRFRRRRAFKTAVRLRVAAEKVADIARLRRRRLAVGILAE